MLLKKTATSSLQISLLTNLVEKQSLTRYTDLQCLIAKLSTAPDALLCNISFKSCFDFSPFYRAMKELLPQRTDSNLPTPEFLSWLIGFTEGDGSFVMIKRNKSATFVITQSIQDLQILDLIKERLGFGKVHKQGKRTSRYIVQDRSGLYILYSLFNGNLIFPSRKVQFKKWVEWGGLGTLKKNKKKFSSSSSDAFLDCVINREILPSLDNGWISGLTDSEGCFTASFLSKSTAFRLRFILSQKGDLNLPVLSRFIELFQGGALEAHSIKGNYSYILSGGKNSYKIYRYFSEHPLRTKKAESFNLWRSLHVEIFQKNHLLPERRAILSEKAKRINSIRRKSK
jgi:hypothetical protein